MDEIPEMDEDELIDELVDLIEHEPKAGGLFGVTKKEHEKYMEQISTIIEKLNE